MSLLFLSVISLARLALFIGIKCTFLFLVIFFALESTLHQYNNPCFFFSLIFAQCMFFPFFTFILPVSLYLKWLPYRQHIVSVIGNVMDKIAEWSLIRSASFCLFSFYLLFGVFRPFFFFFFGRPGSSLWCTGSLPLHTGFLLCCSARGFPLRWLLLLQSTGFRARELLVHWLSNCGTWALEHAGVVDVVRFALQHVGY